MFDLSSPADRQNSLHSVSQQAQISSILYAITRLRPVRVGEGSQFAFRDNFQCRLSQRLRERVTFSVLHVDFHCDSVAPLISAGLDHPCIHTKSYLTHCTISERYNRATSFSKSLTRATSKLYVERLSSNHAGTTKIVESHNKKDGPRGYSTPTPADASS